MAIKKKNFVAVLAFFSLWFFFNTKSGFSESEQNSATWYVCAGSFEFDRFARQLMEKMRNEGIPVFIEPAFSKDVLRVYRVMIDMPFSTAEEAREFCRKFMKTSFAIKNGIKDAWVSNAPIHSGEAPSKNAQKILPQKHTPLVPVEPNAPIVQKNDFSKNKTATQNKKEEPSTPKKNSDEKNEEIVTNAENLPPLPIVLPKDAEQKQNESEPISEEKNPPANKEEVQNEPIPTQENTSENETPSTKENEGVPEEPSIFEKENLPKDAEQNQSESEPISEEKNPPANKEEVQNEPIPTQENTSENEEPSTKENEGIPEDATPLLEPSEPLSPPAKNANESKTTQPIQDSALLKNDALPVLNEKPYSFFVQSYHDFSEAQNDMMRLKEKKVEAFILKRYNDDELFTFDLCVGAGNTEGALSEQKTVLEGLDIFDLETRDFRNYSAQTNAYDEIVSENKINLCKGGDALPKNFSQHITSCFAQLAFCKNFSLDRFKLVNAICARKNSFPYEEDLAPYDIEENAISQISAYACARYRDSLFRKTAEVFVAISDAPIFSVSNNAGLAVEEQKDFEFEGTIMHSLLLKDEYGYLFSACSDDKKKFVRMDFPDFTKDELVAFLDNFTTHDSVLSYSQIRRSLCILPENSSRDFLMFDLAKNDSEYEEVRNYDAWSRKAFGYQRSHTIFIQDGEKLNIENFDFNYDYGIRAAYEIYNGEHINLRKNYDTNFDEQIHGIDGWFYVDSSKKALVFPIKSSVFSINGAENSRFTLEKLKATAEELKVWE